MAIRDLLNFFFTASLLFAAAFALDSSQAQESIFSQVMGQKTAPTNDELRTVLISQMSGSYGDHDSAHTKVQYTGRFGQFEFIYDPTLVADGQEVLATLHDLREQSSLMRTPEFQEKLKSYIVVPFSTENLEDLEIFKIFTKREMQVFMTRKSRYLDKVGTVLSALRLPAEVVNKVLFALNDQLFKHADVVSRANTTSTSIALNVGFGAGLPEWFLAQLRKAPLLSRVPEKAGFFIGFSVGLALVHSTEGGVRRVRLEPFADFRRSEKILGALLSASTSISVATEISIPSGSSADGSHSKFVSFGGNTLSSTRSSLGVGRTLLGVSFPPFGGRFTVIQGTNHSFRADLSGLDTLVDYVADYLRQSPVVKKVRSCRALLAAPSVF